MWHRKAMDKDIVKVMATKFSEIFAISMLKKHRKFCRRGLTHLNATPTFKNRPNTYGPPCNQHFQRYGVKLLKIEIFKMAFPDPTTNFVSQIF